MLYLNLVGDEVVLRDDVARKNWDDMVVRDELSCYRFVCVITTVVVSLCRCILYIRNSLPNFWTIFWDYCFFNTRHNRTITSFKKVVEEYQHFDSFQKSMFWSKLQNTMLKNYNYFVNYKLKVFKVFQLKTLLFYACPTKRMWQPYLF